VGRHGRLRVGLWARRGGSETVVRVESPSTRRWLGVAAALSGLPAAGGCFCAALMLAIVADSDPGAVYEQHPWLGAVIAAGAACAFGAMLGWATLGQGGVPAPLLLIAVVVAGIPFTLPAGLFVPAAALAVVACAALATVGLARPPASSRPARRLTGGLAALALALAIGQAVVVGLHGSSPSRAKADVAATHANAHAVPARRPAKATRRKAHHRVATPRTIAPRASAPATTTPRAATPAPTTPGATGPATTTPRPTAPATTAPRPAAPTPTAPVAAPPTAATVTAATRFVRDYYAQLDARRFGAAWNMLAPSAQTAFGGLAAWRKGYGRTISSRPEAISVTTPAGTGATVGLTLLAADRGACGTIVVRRFAVTWQLARAEAGWRATAATARQLPDSAPAATC
jgi:hypothetical protein